MEHANGNQFRSLNFVDTPVPAQFSSVIERAWYCVGREPGLPEKCLALVMKERGTDRALTVMHIAGNPHASTQKHSTLELAREHVKRVCSTWPIIPRLWE